MKKIKNEFEYLEALERAEYLTGLDPMPNTAEGKELIELSNRIEEYEEEHYPIPNPNQFDE